VIFADARKADLSTANQVFPRAAEDLELDFQVSWRARSDDDKPVSEGRETQG